MSNDKRKLKFDPNHPENSWPKILIFDDMNTFTSNGSIEKLYEIFAM